MVQSVRLSARSNVQEELKQIRQHLLDEKEALLQSSSQLPPSLELEISVCEQALCKCAEGCYGYCDSCGESIELNRLKADPLVRYCLACSSRYKIE
ncbi:TraR/DksA family transcriptional regulator [Nitrincola tibetensis]|uniref:TraR/DksA family transcriptional regulator n=1 Tax=Nitrincola tibetensis TaxID=2219697 RepID=A0A364NNL4_9GAMM|nr:TraR/DksA C4-type zinc finger protein [Nitrincola tibetensis]RAU18475.1 TraR/DksA family transcriptional regulator [Nitrincola tibetensis]